ncbi:MAG: nucleotidyltransferase domain-containing protein [Deltaproteobacteria bacterium]|nr:nucleotidyltransferase domain-containing protein [Deltaproteobacteria bacterium]
MNHGLRDSDLRAIAATMAMFPQVESAWLFGSRAKGTHRLGSDVDLAVRGERLGEVLWQLLDRLNEELPLPYKFDVIDWSAVQNPALLDHLARVAVQLYVRCQVAGVDDAVPPQDCASVERGTRAAEGRADLLRPTAAERRP